MKHWLFKSEPSTFSIDDLARAKGKTTCWDGVRNYQARNFMRDEIKKGDLGFFYHSSCDPAGIVGIVEVVREAYPDTTAFDRKSSYFDPKSRADDPTWFMVDLKLKRKLNEMITLKELRRHASSRLSEFRLLRKGNRLSVFPLEKSEWNFILTLAK
jgi:predicted RNA-binding protein with PUA-like domain